MQMVQKNIDIEDQEASMKQQMQTASLELSEAQLAEFRRQEYLRGLPSQERNLEETLEGLNKFLAQAAKDPLHLVISEEQVEQIEKERFETQEQLKFMRTPDRDKPAIFRKEVIEKVDKMLVDSGLGHAEGQKLLTSNLSQLRSIQEPEDLYLAVENLLRVPLNKQKFVLPYLKPRGKKIKGFLSEKFDPKEESILGSRGQQWKESIFDFLGINDSTEE